MNVTLFGKKKKKKSLEDVIKDLELRRPSWIIQVGPKFNNKCTYQRQAKRDLKQKKRRQKHTGEVDVTTVTKIAVMRSQVKEWQGQPAAIGS